MRIEPPIAMEDLPECVLEAGEGEPIGPMTVNQYFRMPETRQRESLVYGWLVREPWALGGHEFSIVRFLIPLDKYVTERNLGIVTTADLVLDEPKRLVVQPDLMVIFRDRWQWRKGRLRRAPNIAIEVLSPKTAKRDRTVKQEWYRTYGVQEYWIVDVRQKRIEVIDLTAQPEPVVTTYAAGEVLRSRVLQDFTCPLADIFEPVYRFVNSLDSEGEVSCTPDANDGSLTRYDTDTP
jgi:Uma2 family endonuclease